MMNAKHKPLLRAFCNDNKDMVMIHGADYSGYETTGIVPLEYYTQAYAGIEQRAAEFIARLSYYAGANGFDMQTVIELSDLLEANDISIEQEMFWCYTFIDKYAPIDWEANKI